MILSLKLTRKSDTMLIENTVDAVAFYITMGIFAVIIGNLIYEVVISNWLSERNSKCLELCGGGEE